jgi:hypothetical protein
MRALPGYDALTLNARYSWRVRALDVRGASSAWSADEFVHGALQTQPPPPAEPVTLHEMRFTEGGLHLSWTPSARPVHVEFTESLNDPHWATVAGSEGLTTDESGVNFNAVSNAPRAFFRIVAE